MDAVIDIISAGEVTIPIMNDMNAPIDLLNRQKVVDRLIKILTVISKKESSCTFALNGAWGTGKSFVLQMLMNQLWEYHSENFIVFHYNCWQYDYYDEPLIAIVAAMLDSVDEESHLLPASLRDKTRAGMELAKPVLRKIATDFVKNKIGVDITEVISVTNDFYEKLEREGEKRTSSRSFDEFYSFKKAIKQAQDGISKLTKNYTLVVVVDELDRCLPNYAIKVLERIHHLFDGIDNSAVIIAVDKSQLNQTISQSFGSNTNITKYLRKFISFEIQLDDGDIQSGIWDKYSEYLSFFDENLIAADFHYEDYIVAPLSELSIRTQERVIERLMTIHSILFPNDKKDYTFMCFELTWAVLHECFGSCEVSSTKVNFDTGNEYATLKLNSTIGEKLLSFVEEFWSSDYLKVLPHNQKTQHIRLWGRNDGYIQIALLYYISELGKSLPKYRPDESLVDILFPLSNNLADLYRFCELFALIT